MVYFSLFWRATWSTQIYFNLGTRDITSNSKRETNQTNHFNDDRNGDPRVNSKSDDRPIQNNARSKTGRWAGNHKYLCKL